MFKNKTTLSLVYMVILAIWGCGTMAKDDDTLSVPQKVSIDMPKALKVDTINASKSEKTLYLKVDDNRTSVAYLELKEDVELLEEERVDVEINLLFINEVILEIDNRCKTLEKEEVCLIEEDELSFLFDEPLSIKLKSLTTEDLGYEIGDILSYGEIKFVQHNSSNKYAYTLTMDLSFNEVNSSSFESISWSKDEKFILSEYKKESSEAINSIKINFSTKEDNSKEIIVDDSWFSKEDTSSDSFYLEMLKNVDINESYDIYSNSISIDDDGGEESFTSLGILTKQGGGLNFSGEFKGETFNEYDTFDEDGNILTSIYCYSDMDCDLEDEETWFND